MPSLFIGLITLRAFQGEESRQQFQQKERQWQIIRFLETELSNWLFSLQSQTKPAEGAFRFQAYDCVAVQGGLLPASEFLYETLSRLIDGHWELTGAQWVLYADEISAALQRCPNQSQTATIARAQQIGKLIHSLLDGYPEVLALAQSLKAEDGLMGVEAILRFKPDLVVLDLMLPGKNGFEILQGSSSKSSTTVALAGTV